MLHWELTQSWGEGIFPVVVRDPQCALKIDMAHCFLMDLRETEGKLIAE